MSELDPFDDFEFKPLTDGLGFHQKAEKIKADVKSTRLDDSPRVPEAPPRFTDSPSPFGASAATVSSKSSSSSRSPDIARPASQSISDLIASLPPSLDFHETPSPIAPAPTKSASPARPQIFQPLARPENKSSDKQNELKSPLASMTALAGPTIGSVLPAPLAKSTPPLSTSSTSGSTSGSTSLGGPVGGSVGGAAGSPYRDKMNESFAKAFPQAEQRTRVAATPAVETGKSQKLTAVHNIPGAILDGMVTLGISTIFLVCILAITRVNLMGLLSNANTDVSTQVHLLMLFVAVLQMYMLTARSFFGASLGEWAFDLQVGTDDQQRSALYPLQVAWRTLLVTFTGFLLLPLLSMIFKRDLAQPLTGLELVRRP